MLGLRQLSKNFCKRVSAYDRVKEECPKPTVENTHHVDVPTPQVYKTIQQGQDSGAYHKPIKRIMHQAKE